MNRTKCPGQDTRYWKPGDIFEIPCANCGRIIEFFKDDASRKCPGCGNRIQNPRITLGCAEWCEHARECLGYDPVSINSGNARAETDASLCGSIVNSIKLRYGEESAIFINAVHALEKASALLKNNNSDPKIVKAAALLLEVDAQSAEEIMKNAGLDSVTIESVSEILNAYRNGHELDTPEFRIISSD